MKIHEYMSAKEVQEARCQLAKEAANGTRDPEKIKADLRKLNVSTSMWQELPPWQMRRLLRSLD
jgi:hypothetical protein